MRRTPLAVALVLWAGTAIAADTDIRTLRTKVYRALDGEPLQAYLSGAHVVPPNLSLAMGHATFYVDLAANTLTYEITHDVAGETAAHIHGPADLGQNAPSLHTLPLGSPKNGVWNYTDAQETALMAGRLYVDIHSGLYPDGEIRDQIVCYEQPVLDKSVCLRVVVQNLGPDPYIGAGALLSGDALRLLPRTTSLPGNKLQVSVDIDEPSKPGGMPGTLAEYSREFDVSIAPGDSLEIDFGTVGIVLPTAGTNHVRTTSTAQGANVDPVPGNNTAVDAFDVLPVLPAAGAFAALTGAIAVSGAAGRALRRRRGAASTPARRST
jgi:hypothetical protein